MSNKMVVCEICGGLMIPEPPYTWSVVNDNGCVCWLCDECYKELKE